MRITYWYALLRDTIEAQRVQMSTRDEILLLDFEGHMQGGVWPTRMHDGTARKRRLESHARKSRMIVKK